MSKKKRCTICDKKIKSLETYEMCRSCGADLHELCAKLSRLPEKVLRFDFNEYSVCRQCLKTISQKFDHDTLLKKAIRSHDDAYNQGYEDGYQEGSEADFDEGFEAGFYKGFAMSTYQGSNSEDHFNTLDGQGRYSVAVRRKIPWQK